MSGTGAHGAVDALAGVTNAGNITGTITSTDVDNITALSNTDSNDVLAITLSGTITKDKLNTVKTKTGGVVTATFATDITNGKLLNTDNNDQITITLSDTGGVNATDLSSVGGKSGATVTLTNGQTISGSESELTAALITAASKVVLGGSSDLTMSGTGAIDKVNALAGVTNAGDITGTITSTDGATLAAGMGNIDTDDVLAVTISGTPTITQVNSVAGSTGGVVTATIAAGNYATQNTLTTTATDVITLTVNDEITVTQFDTLNGKTAGDITVSGGVSGTAAEFASTAGVATASLNALDAQNTNFAVTTSDATNIAQYNAIDGKNGNGSITVASLTDEIDNLIDNGSAHAAVSGSLDVALDAATITDVTNINLIRAATTGDVSCTISGTAAILQGLTASTTDTLNITVTGAAASVTHGAAICDATKGTVDFSAGGLDDTTSNLSADTYAALDKVVAKDGDVVITISDATTTLEASVLQTVGGKTSGNVTVTNAQTKIQGTEAELTAALVTAETKVILGASTPLEISSGTGAIDKVNALAGVTNAGNITGTITSTDGATLAAGMGNIDSNDVLAVTISGTPTITQVNSVAGSTGGVVTATIAAGNYATQNTLTTASSDVISVTVNDEITVTQFNTLNAKTAGDITVSGGVSGTAAEFASTAGVVTASLTALDTQNTNFDVTTSDATNIAQYDAINGKNGNGSITVASLADAIDNLVDNGSAHAAVAGTIAVALTTATITSETNINLVRAATSGNVSGSITGTAAVLAGLSASNTDGLVLTVSDDATAAEGNSIVAATTANVTFSGGIVDSSANLVSGTGISTHLTNVTDNAGADNINVTVTSGNGTVTAAQGAAIVGVIGTGTLFIADGVSDSLANLQAGTPAYANLDTIVGKTPNMRVTINDSTGTDVAATVLSTIGGKTTGVVTVTNALDISGSLAQLTPALVDSATLVVAATSTVEFSDTDIGGANVADLNAIAAKTSAQVTGTISGTAAQLDDLSTGQTDALTITVSDAVTAAQGNTITGATNVSTVTLSAGISDSFASLLTNNAAHSNLTNTTAHATSANIEITDSITDAVAANVTQLNAIRGTTTGSVTATITGIPSVLSNLDTSASDNLSITVKTSAATVSEAKVCVDATSKTGGTAIDFSSGLTGSNSDYFSESGSGNALSANLSAVIAKDADVAITHTGAAMTVAQSRLLVAGTSGNLTGSITGTTANYITNPVLNTDGTNDTMAIAVTDTISVANFNTIDGKTAGAITLTSITDSVDNLHDGTNLNGIFTGRGSIPVAIGTVTLNAAGVVKLNAVKGATTGIISGAVTGTAAHLGDASNGLTGHGETDTFTVTISDNSVTLDATTLAQVNKVKASTKGTVTATISGGQSNVGSLNTTTSDPITLTVSDAVTAAQGKTATDKTSASTITLSSGISDSFAGLTNGSGLSTNLSTLKDHLTSNSTALVINANATMTSADDVTALNTVTALAALTGTSGGANTITGTSTLLKNLNAHNNKFSVKLAFSDTVAAANITTNVNPIIAATTGTVTGAIGSGTFTQLNNLTTGASNPITMSVSGTISVANFNTLNAKTAGDVTISGTVQGNAADFAATNGDITASLTAMDAQNTNFDVSVSDAITVAQYDTIDGKNGNGSITLTSVSDSISNLSSNGNANGIFTGRNPPVTISGTNTITDAADINAIRAATSGDVTATLQGAATVLKDLTGSSTDTLTIVVTGAAASPAHAKLIVDATKATTVDFSAGGLSGTAAEYADTSGNATGDMGVFPTADPDVAITVTDTANVAQGVTIAGKTSGTISFHSITDTLANLVASSYGNIDTITNDDSDVPINIDEGNATSFDATAVVQLYTIGGKSSGNVTLSEVDHDFTGTAAQLTSLLITANSKIILTTPDTNNAEDQTLYVTGTPAYDEVNALAGVATVTVVSGDEGEALTLASTTAANLASANFSNLSTDDDNINVTISDDPSFANLFIIAGRAAEITFGANASFNVTDFFTTGTTKTTNFNTIVNTYETTINDSSNPVTISVPGASPDQQTELEKFFLGDPASNNNISMDYSE